MAARLRQPLYRSSEHPEERPYYIAVTGHRQFPGLATIRFVTKSFRSLLQQLQLLHPEGIVALSGLAEGADTIFAEQALDLGIPLGAIIAYRDLIADFPPGSSRARYLRLCALSRVLHVLPFSERSIEAYTALGRQLVNSCDLLVAAWNGLPPIDEGGTGAVVSYAQMLGRPVIHVHTVKHLITYNSVDLTVD